MRGSLLFQVGLCLKVLVRTWIGSVQGAVATWSVISMGYLLAANKKQTRPFAPFGTVNNPIRVMSTEHDTAGQILRELRALTSDYKVPPDACISYQTLYEALENFEKDLHQHIHLENNLLFPKALELENILNQ